MAKPDVDLGKVDKVIEEGGSSNNDLKNEKENNEPVDLGEQSIKESLKESQSQNQDVDEKNLHYEDGVCIYTDPDSKCQYVWDEKKQEWITKDGSQSDRDYEFDGSTYSYRDKETSKK